MKKIFEAIRSRKQNLVKVFVDAGVDVNKMLDDNGAFFFLSSFTFERKILIFIHIIHTYI